MHSVAYQGFTLLWLCLIILGKLLIHYTERDRTFDARTFICMLTHTTAAAVECCVLTCYREYLRASV